MTAVYRNLIPLVGSFDQWLYRTGLLSRPTRFLLVPSFLPLTNGKPRGPMWW